MLQQSNTPVRHQSASEPLVEQSSSMPGYEKRAPVEHSSSTHRKSTLLVKHSSSMDANSWSELHVEQLSPTPGSETESTVEPPVRRQSSSPNSTLMYLLRCLWSTCRIRRRQTRRRRFQKSNLMYALYVATRLWNLPLIGSICYRFIGWMWSR